ncbi:MAG: LytTR family DNA-binding domain-containing protein [Melioribacteraceae bacterium]|nr:LytTR family DNA-binding domain-containing protein [Melioribacteraceae bacterium]MCF8356193.1 LytTR family DNA-binding domain-containing protein [Melioribacteraceae bacterium]MCF8394691.1 LytTR family DNA-binding domain-containing protein [Melioribacteraceae bacterium]MCF8420231.1 LytTR family DNA-binding domain-containing protein [Melioribacteraceae bacterium]
MKTKCMIVDDEPLAIEAIEMHINELKDFEVAAKCENAIEAFEILKKRKIDLLFLDIQMPKLTGMEFLRSLKNPPKVIITTAYSDYAIEGYELDVIDYLLKPIPFDRFLQAIDKFHRAKDEGIIVVEDDKLNSTTAEFIYVRADRKAVKIKLNEILYLESMRDYVQIKTETQTVTTKNLLGKFEEKLPGNKFLRIHRSFIINKDKVDSFTSFSINIGKKELTIATSYKSRVLNELGYGDKMI